MTASRLARRLRLFVPLAALGVLIFAGTSYGQATVGNFSFQEPLNGTITDFACGPIASGVLTGTATTVGHFTLTDQGIHIHGTFTQDYRIDFADGSYLLSYSPSHFESNLNLRSGQAVSTEAQQDRGILYTAAGQPIGPVNVFTLTHTTWRDTNGNGFPDAGEITANVSKVRFTCP